MNSIPDTRASLLIRVRDPADQVAWEEFVEIYRPVILRLARQKGMQAADADDVAQQVLIAVAKAVQQREHDRKRANAGLQYLSALDRLRTLGLANTSITDQGLLALSAMQNLSGLDLEGTGVGDKGMEVQRRIVLAVQIEESIEHLLLMLTGSCRCSIA